MSFQVKADSEETNYTKQLDSIFNALKEDIENGLSNTKLKFVLNNGMDDLGINFRGRKTRISQYVDSKREEIEEIRISHKRQRRMGEVINLFNCTKFVLIQ